MKPDAELQVDVQDELLWETRVEEAAGIAVFVRDGTVTLRGTVGSLGAKGRLLQPIQELALLDLGAFSEQHLVEIGRDARDEVDAIGRLDTADIVARLGDRLA